MFWFSLSSKCVYLSFGLVTWSSSSMIPFVARQVPCIGVFIPYIFGIVSSGALLFLIHLCQSFTGIMALSVGFGSIFASFGCLQPQTVLELVGEDFLSTGYGYLLVSMALGSLMGASTAGTSRLVPQKHFPPPISNT